MEWIWKSALIVVVGTLLLRVAGRKSISQMTLSQTVIMISIGSLLIQPVSGQNIWVALGVGAMLIATLLVLEYGQIKIDWIEAFLTGKSKTVIEDGLIKESNLRKMKITIDQLEMRLRQAGISKISDVKYATIEPNGQLGYVLKETARYATKEDIQKVIDLIHAKLPQMSANPYIATKRSDDLLFEEVDQRKHEHEPPSRLQ